MTAEPGLRERKKQQTRQTIAEAARRLFGERGFDAVTVADVARAADVSIGTVFNYFPAKEDLFYSQMEIFEAALVDAVRQRPPGESVLAAFRRFLLGSSIQLADQQRAEVIAHAARIINDSAALQAREREIVAFHTRELANLIADDTGVSTDDLEPQAVARALMGAHRALVDYVRSSVLTGRRGPTLAAHARSQANRAFSRLEHGLADYGVKKR